MSDRVSRRLPVLVLASAVAGALAVAPASAQPSPCPDSFTSYGSLSVGKSFSCTCSEEQVRAGTVWGSRRYSADSSVCAAARHAGVVEAGGGRVTVYRQGSCGSLSGSTRNGVTSQDWGAYELTFAFAHPAPPCNPAAKVTGVDSCPASMKGQEARRTSQPLECACSAQQFTGTVWGSDRYTFDSSVCAAARHAGAVRSSGGNVLVFTAGSCETFKGSARDDVTSSDWGAFKNTFAFVYPVPRCVDDAGSR
jgi:hypothetical protein